MLTVTIEGLDELARDLAAGDRVLSDGIRQAVDSACKEGADEARTVHRWKNRSRDLENSIKGYVETSTHGGAVGVIEATMPYAEVLEHGSKAHTIEARGEKPLTFVGRDGTWVSKWSVEHPGTQPSPFMGPAALKAERIVERDVEIAAQNAAKIVNR